MTITSLHGDCLDLLPTIAPASVQMLATSPPYFGLRSYTIPPSSWPAIEYTPLIGLPSVVVPPMVCQLGAESDPLAYIAHLVHVFRLARPALRADATLWCNLGDSYASDTKGSGGAGKSTLGPNRDLQNIERQKFEPRKLNTGIPDKNLLGIPARAALALQADGWVWRNRGVWHKTNGMPESVRDRFTRAHEDVLLFGNSARYYFDAAAVAEEAAEPDRVREDRFGGATGHNVRHSVGGMSYGHATRNRRDVLTIATAPMPAHLRSLDEAHYAAWPPALVEVMVKAGSANKACAACGAAWVRQVEREEIEKPKQTGRGWVNGVADQDNWQSGTPTHSGLANSAYQRTNTLGFAPACTCAAAVGRCVVLDPFGGTGTTGAVAETLGRDAILIDLGYQELQARRTDGLQISMEALL